MQTPPTAPRRRPRQERSKQTVDVLLTATARVLAREGAAQATTNRIAEVAGVSIGSLYQYFPNKAALIEALRERFDRQFDERVRGRLAALADASLEDAVRGAVDVMIVLHADDPELHNALSELRSEPEFQAKLADLETDMTRLTVALLERHREAVRPDDLELAARVCMGAIEGLTHGTALRDPELLRDPKYAAELSELVLRYLRR